MSRLHVVLALETGLPVVLLVVGVSGTATGAVNPIIAVVTSERIPERMRGRALSPTTLVSQGGTPLGCWVDGIGLVPTLWLTAGLRRGGTRAGAAARNA